MEMFWTTQRVARLEFLWAEDWTCSQIAADLGCTRNAVIGKADRLMLPSKTLQARLDPAEVRRRRLERQRIYDAKRQNKPFKPRLVMEAPPIVLPDFVGNLRIPTRDLRDFKHEHANQCRFIADEPPGPDYLACGNETLPGKSYCPHCTEMLRPKTQPTQAERTRALHMGIRRHQRALRRVA